MQPNFRRAVIYGVLCGVAVVVGSRYLDVDDRSTGARIAAYGCALAVLLFGMLATRATADEVRRIVVPRGGLAAATSLRIAILVAGYAITILLVLDALNVSLRGLLVGGAVTGVIVGIAAQQTLGNFFAGLVLLFARPYVPGDRVTVYSGTLGGPHIGEVAAVGLLYTSLETANGSIKIPNGGLLASAVGPAVEEAATEAPPANTPPPGQPYPQASGGRAAENGKEQGRDDT